MEREKVPFSRREKLLSAAMCLLTVLSLSLFASYKQAAGRLSAEIDKPSAIGEAETTVLQTETETETHQAETTTEKQTEAKTTEKPKPTQKKSTKGTSSKPEKATPSSPVNINTGGLQELCRLGGIGEVKAQAIIDYRDANGPFELKEDLMKVKGIGEKTFENIKDCIVL